MKQAYLSQEMSPPKDIQEIEAAAEELHSIRTERIGLNEREEQAQTTLVGVMEKHQLDVYKFKGLIVTIEQGKTKAKVRSAAGDEPPKEDH